MALAQILDIDYSGLLAITSHSDHSFACDPDQEDYS